MSSVSGTTSSHRLARKITGEAQELLASTLPAAGRRYRWADLLPAMIEAALERARSGADLTGADRAELERAAQHAARDWIPLHELERACQIVVNCVCRALWDLTGPPDCSAMLAVTRWAADQLPDVVGTLRAAYVEEMRRLGTRRADDGIIIGAMLDGGDAAGLARAVGRPLPEPCALIALTCAQPPAGGGGFSFTVPPSSLLEALAGDPAALCAPSWDKNALMVVSALTSRPAGESARQVRTLAEQLIEACGAAYGLPFVAGMAVADTGTAAPAAAREAVNVAALLASPDPPRLMAFSEDVALEALLADEDSPLRSRLAARVAPVRARPDLWATLREIYRADLDRGRTARRLGIHRSTLDYRLDRIEQLTDACPTSVHGILLFTAARAALGDP